MFIAEDRDKHSLFKTIEKQSEEMPAPAYLSHQTLVKKTYNATLPPKKFV